MTSRSLATVALSLTMLFAASCTNDSGGKQRGQNCLETAECASGLECRNRTCVPASNDAGTDAITDPPACGEPGPAGECATSDSYFVCESDGTVTTEACGEEEICTSGGQCQAISEVCQDLDDDGFYTGCPIEEDRDCDDTDPLTNPDAREVCQNDFDDDCDGVIDEGCEPCCEGGCGDGEFCSDCSCTSYSAATCTAQNQPCSNPNSRPENGLLCTGGFASSPRCFGLCDLSASNPDTTCPGSDSVCAFVLSRRQEIGMCLSTCSLKQGCGVDNLGCLPRGGSGEADGVCAPIDPENRIGESCQPSETFDCQAGALCVSSGGGGGICRRACRPFKDGGSDCTPGNHCRPISDTAGVCVPDTDASLGERCSEPGTTCGEDAVGCFGDSADQARCYRLCRASVGDDDCLRDAASCEQGSGRSELGFCVVR
jgi:hypothetical protein